MTLRVNAQKTDVASYPARAGGRRACRPCPSAPAGCSWQRARPVQQLPGFADGEFSVQDAAAQLAAPLLLDGLRAHGAAPLRVLDACAAPGGKTAHLLEFAAPDAIEVTALEVDAVAQPAHRRDPGAARPERQGRRRRCGAPAAVVGRRALRRHPARRAVHRLGHRAPPSRRALAAPRERHRAAGAPAGDAAGALWPLVRPGGRLLYCTCSVFREEGAHQIDAFLAHNTDARLLPSPGHLLPQSGVNARGVPDNALGDHDGFFYALLEKRRADRPRPGLAGRVADARRAPGMAARAGRCAIAHGAADDPAAPRTGRRRRLPQRPGAVRAAAARSRRCSTRASPSISWPRPSSTATAGTGPTSKWHRPRGTCGWPTSRSPAAGGSTCRPCPSPTQASASR